MTIDQRLRRGAGDLQRAAARHLETAPTTNTGAPGSLPLVEARPTSRSRGPRWWAAAAAAVVVAVAAGATLTWHRSSRSSSVQPASLGASALEWTAMRAQPGVFPPGSTVVSAVAWHRDVVAVGSEPNTDCTAGSQGCSQLKGSEWISQAGGPWRRLAFDLAPSGFANDVAVVATPSRLLLFVEQPPGAGWGTAPPPYENLTYVWSSTDGVHWRSEVIPTAMTQSALGPVVSGHGVLLAVANDRAVSQVGAWILRSGRWSFHPFSGAQGAGVFAWSLTSTPTGFLAVGWEGTDQRAAVWTSEDGVHWKPTPPPGGADQLTAVATIGGRVYAGGAAGAGSGSETAFWGFANGHWQSLPLAGTLRNPAAIYSSPEGPVAVPSTGNLGLLSGGSWRPIPGSGTPTSDRSVWMLTSVSAQDQIIVFVESPNGASAWQLATRTG